MPRRFLLASVLFLVACASGQRDDHPDPPDAGESSPDSSVPDDAGGGDDDAGGGRMDASRDAGDGGTDGGVDTDGGVERPCTEAEDCPWPDLACAATRCVRGRCERDIAPEGTVCNYNGGSVCDGGGACVECTIGSDCAEGVCMRNRCVPPGCTDGVANGDETGVDCGGSCAPCDNGMGCEGASDCLSHRCVTGTCRPCASDTECDASDFCDSSARCVPRLADGDACTAHGQCQSGYCPAQDGVCCESSCEGTCVACSRVRTGQPNGQCEPVLAGTDPDMECASTDPSTCGPDGTGCNGSASDPGCNLHPMGTVCGPGSCTAGELSSGSECDGEGNCEPAAPTSCSPYVCNDAGTACATQCAGDSDCATGFECSMMSCVPPCSSGEVRCDGTCIDPMTDSDYCGAMAGCTGYTACASDENCVDGACTTMPPLDPQCSQPYNELSAAQRLGGSGATLCDDSTSSSTSVDWVGPGWYRFTGAAGTQIRTTPPPSDDYSHCRTSAKGWLDGSHPAIADGVVTRRVCYRFTGTDCWRNNNIEIVNCGSFYLYNLPDVAFCYLAYCGQ